MKAKKDALAKKKEEEKAKAEADLVNDAIKFTADFHKEVFKVYGEKAEKLAQGLEKQAKGKTILNAKDALNAYEKHMSDINKKINAKDREAIGKALESRDVKVAAKNFKMFSKGLGVVGVGYSAFELSDELIKATKTGNWYPFFLKAETIVVGMGASSLAALAFSTILGGPVGILGYALIMGGIGAVINESLVEDANELIGL